MNTTPRNNGSKQKTPAHRLSNFKNNGVRLFYSVRVLASAATVTGIGFADQPESAFFYGQAVNELAVIATTDRDEGMTSASRRKSY